MKFMFFSLNTLADSSNGAARSALNLLAELARQGHQCMAVTGSLIDAPNELFEKVLAQPPINADALPRALPVRQVVIDGVEQVIVCFHTAYTSELRMSEEFTLRDQFVSSFLAYQPDVVVTYGGFLSCAFAGFYAMAQKRTSVLYMCTDSYHRPDQVAYANRIVGLSQALLRQQGEIASIQRSAIPPIVNRRAVKAEERTPDYITFINPIPAKGLKLAAALVAECARRGRDYEFLFVEARGNRETMLKLCPELEDMPNLTVAPNTSDIRDVYERTKILLVPSVWFEAAGMVCIEANANGIPVLAHKVGGIAEMLDGAGYLFDPPPQSLTNWSAEVPAPYIEKWIETLDHLHGDPLEFRDAERRAWEADARYDIAALARRFADFVKP